MKLKLSRLHLIIRILINQTNNQIFMFWNLFKKRKKEYSDTNIKKEVFQSKEKRIDLIRFFKNEETDSKWRYHQDILQFTDEQIEYNHDFIQWIFPTIEKSQFHPDSPTIDKRFKERFQKDELATYNYCKSC